MKNLSNVKFPEAKEDSTVQIKILDVDRGKGYPRLVIAVVLKITDFRDSINLDVKVVRIRFINFFLIYTFKF
jgi:hypothetical protein